MTTEMGQAGETFVGQVHSALLHLYDPIKLRHSPLLALFGLDKNESSVADLGRLLTEAIHRLKPAPSVPSDSGAWRNYRLLTRRFLDHLPQKQAAGDLGFSERQMRRQEQAAVRYLANCLWERYHLAAKGDATPSINPSATSHADSLDTTTPDQEDELAWLKGSFPSETADVAEVIATALRNAASLLERGQVRVECKIPENRPPVSGQLPILRLALLNLISAAATSAPAGMVRVAVLVSDAAASVAIEITVGDGVKQATPEREAAGKVGEYLETARQLIQLFGGQIEINHIGEGDRGQPPQQLRSAWVSVSALEQVPVLVIDDNVDTLRLLQRSLAGTRYRFIGTQDPTGCVAFAVEVKPQVILLDIMLPGVDGLDLLGRFREHPQTRHLPVIVCSILPQEEIVMTLGAAGFIRKPVSQSALLSMLDRQMALHPQELSSAL